MNNEKLIHSLESDGGLNLEIYEHLNCVIKLDTSGNLVSYNQAFFKQYGYNEQDFIEPFLDFFIQSEPFEKKQYFEKSLLGKTQRFNTLGLCKNGETVEINVTLIPIKKKTEMSIYVIVKNISEFQEQEKELFLAKKTQTVFNELNDICSFYYDAINDFHHFSKQFPVIFGINTEKKISPSLKLLLQYVHPEDLDRVKDTVYAAIRERTGYQMEYRLVRKDRTVRYVYEQAEIVLTKKGHLEGLVGFIQDNTERKVSNDLIVKEDQIALFNDNPLVGVWSVNVQTDQCLNTSMGIEYICGYTKNDFNNGIQWSSIVHKEDLSQYLDNQHTLEGGNILHHQYRIVHKNGDIRWVQDYTIPTLDEDGEITQLNGLISDITEQKVLKEKIGYLTDYDFLTKLPRGHKFIEKLQLLTEEYADSNNKLAVMKLDIDRFKYVNDTLGNQVGDELLIQISNRLSKHLTSNDLLARRGGDEFLILIGKMKSVESLKFIINKLIESLNEPFYIKEYQLYLTASIGISTYPENGVSSLELLRNASLALSKSQKDGKNNYRILSNLSSIQSYKTYSIGRDLKKAVENNEMSLYFQPRVDALSYQIIGAEALIRWNHPEWGLISPHEFITIAEENGLIMDIDDWVLKEVCIQIKKWKNEQLPTVPISINVSAVHFMKQDWPSTVAKLIRRAGIHPQDIELEITESTLMDNKEMVKQTINKLREMGIKIALDDFGKGYSSISYLSQYSFDTIKIDRLFIRNMLQSERNLHIAKSIIYMAKGLKINVVAEGVETIQQLKILQREHCNEIQGYLFSHPAPINEFETLLQNKKLPPMDPKQKAKQSKRKNYRLNFPYPLEADMKLESIAGQNVELRKTKVLIEDISIGGLRYVSTLKLPVRGDILFKFKTEILGKSITLYGSIVWKEEINEELVEYGIKFIIGKGEQTSLSSLINTFTKSLKHDKSLPPYRMINEDRYQYFKL
ncbi:EAL domain-containing protein [Psychrobacillus sp. NPDC096426]|uniref:EAL domain-containing protein n=1 Tax=Psychrobacillus sp. NPDC096426 TaxID=3364491 RepID=UPI0037F217A1